MQNFHFRLERVLAWRRAACELAEAGMAPLAAEQQRLEMARRAVAAVRERTHRELLSSVSIAGSDLAALALFHARLAKERESIDRQDAQCRERIERQRAQIVEAHRQARLLEKLRERRQAEWREQWDREAESFASEAYLARWMARKAAPRLRAGP